MSDSKSTDLVGKTENGSIINELMVLAVAILFGICIGLGMVLGVKIFY